MILDPLEFEKRPMAGKLQRLRRLAWFCVLWENATIAFWRTDCWIGFFIALWLLQIPGMLGVAGNITALLIFIAGLFYFLRSSLRNFHLPDGNITDRRLEQAGGLKNRPLAFMEDRLANPAKEPTRNLWHQGRENAFKSIEKISLFFPRPLLVAQDPRALRVFVVMLLITGFVVAGPQWPLRIKTGLFPFAISMQGKTSDDVVLWITAPEYTGLPQITLQGTGKAKNAVDVAAGSVVKARVRGWIGTPELHIGAQRLKMTRAGKKNWALETEIAATEKISVYQGLLTRAQIPVNFIADKPPEILLKEEVKKLEKGVIQIPLTVKDDYGVRSVSMKMSLDPVVEEAPLGAPIEETRAMASAPNAETELQPVYDLTWHPWAGLPVIIEVAAKDFPGQSAALTPIHLTLPERSFFHPVARKLVALRKRLIWTPAVTIPNAVHELGNILVKPGEYENDIVAFLSLRSMTSRLHYDPSEKSARAVIEQLWDTALRIEEGNLTMASRDLRKAQKKLQDLLGDPNATDEQIAAAMEEMRQAMAQYFQEMFREMQKRMAQQGGEQMPMMDPKAFGDMIDAQDLAAFLDQLQAEALTGNRDSAQQILSQLQQMMDRMDPSASMSIPPEMQAMMEQMSALKELIEKQQALLDRTQQEADKMRDGGQTTYPDFLPGDSDFMKQWGEGQMPPPPKPEARQSDGPKINTKDWQPQQDELRKMLGDLMLQADEKLGEIPEDMQKAEKEMRGAGEKLGEDRPDLSAPHQQQALDHLQDSMENMNKQMGEMMKQMTLMSFGMGPLDPLGRPLSEGDGPSLLPGSKVKIPDEGERRRVQEILKTLRERSGELERPEYELEYYRRLMKQF